MLLRIDENLAASISQQWLGSPLGGRHPACQFYLPAILTNRLKQVKKAFPATSKHTVAIKANPLPGVLSLIRKQGYSVEAASEGELQLAFDAGFDGGDIIFDSPVKTQQEIELALNKGIIMNIDNFQELSRVALLRKPCHRASAGLRINPQVGAGTIANTSVADSYSKFGMPLAETGNLIAKAYKNHTWLNGIHLHIGSQGCSITLLLAGIEKILKTLSGWRINYPQLNKQLVFIDIGGGLPVSYQWNVNAPDMKSYGSAIEKLLQKHHWTHLQIITEFGRYYHVNAGFSLSRVEYVKNFTTPHTGIIHLGADYFVRECLNPQSWYHEVSVLNAQGKLKKDATNGTYNLAGPLCFAGDIVIRNRTLPALAEGDHIVIHDTGGYTFAMYSRYVSRQMPPIVAVDENLQFHLLRRGESPAETARFWNGL